MSNLEHTFDNFKVNKANQVAYQAFKALAEGNAPPFLLCYGRVGNGKTYLCEALAIELYKRNQLTRVLTMADIMGLLKKSLNPDSALPDLGACVGLYATSPRLIVDDVGMGGAGSVWEYGQLEEIVCYRYREQLLTVLTTNRDLNELPERIVSRFFDPEVGRVVLNDDTDHRRR